MSPMPPPPPVLDSARVIEYAILDDSVHFSGRTNLYLGDEELGPVPCLAICQNLYPEDSDPNNILLLHCDNDWNSLAAASYPSVEAAKAAAERIYPGVSACWKQTGVTEAQARAYLAQQWAGHGCSFCDRIPPQFDRAVEKNGARISNLCLAEFQKPLVG